MDSVFSVWIEVQADIKTDVQADTQAATPQHKVDNTSAGVSAQDTYIYSKYVHMYIKAPLSHKLPLIEREIQKYSAKAGMEN
jgi:hypothetical protein